MTDTTYKIKVRGVTLNLEYMPNEDEWWLRSNNGFNRVSDNPEQLLESYSNAVGSVIRKAKLKAQEINNKFNQNPSPIKG